MSTYYIGADVHSNSTELAIGKKGEIVAQYNVPTSIPAIVNVLNQYQGKKYFAVEEGPMSGWLYRNLKDKLDEYISSDPRRNKLISSEGDKDDRIDSGKLAFLLRGGFLKKIYHTDDDVRAELKHWVLLYHDRVHDAVRSINKMRARCRMHGVTIPRAVLREPAYRVKWLLKTNHSPLDDRLKMLWMGYDANAQQVKYSKGKLSKLSQKYDIIEYWNELPGIGLIRAITIFAFLDTPFRFKRANKLWKYCGVGLQRTTSGTDKKGKPKPARLKLPWAVNGTLKNAILGATQTAINQKDNVFKNYYERKIRDGMIPSNARHSVARKMLSVMWAMWKTNSRFDENLVFLSE